VRNGNPPVYDLSFIGGLWIVFILIGLKRDYRDHTVPLAGLHQLTQVNKPRLRRLPGYTDAYMADPVRGKIPHY